MPHPDPNLRRISTRLGCLVWLGMLLVLIQLDAVFGHAILGTLLLLVMSAGR